MFKGVIQENIDIFYKLKASGNFKIYGLTNWSAEKWDKALELFPFLQDFDGIVVSGQEKCRKPNLKIYYGSNYRKQQSNGTLYRNIF